MGKIFSIVITDENESGTKGVIAENSDIFKTETQTNIAQMTQENMLQKEGNDYG